MRAELINPFVSAMHNVFETMLGCALARGPLSLRHDHTPVYDVSGLIGLSGQYRGMAVVSVDRQTAIRAAEVMLGSPPAELDDDVLDAIGEITNMSAGAAKTQLEQYSLSVGLPTVICGRSQTIRFPANTSPIVIPFDSPLGSVCVEVGLVESPGA